ncbi:hypothetical protein AM571_PA00082 (plasmid) [Rhizobium etli 8C-3]|uniref:Uncharacterized protein n=1 Tax=Rhizobium etli 8C-3 TaxID=538025 RepID=A0A1L5P9V6_RHIET|nr:hypothetical protein AM571_PA00082 [Rhizobium etli 8C-3]
MPDPSNHLIYRNVETSVVCKMRGTTTHLGKGDPLRVSRCIPPGLDARLALASSKRPPVSSAIK